ncbi:zinc finger protein RFP-like [Sphaeramia orbicularis]|uniref:Zinc finger protein RFP-like n=1 Tax=Sphaeramia orbicularis TaxID=375764 RepID=A0A672ZAG0_9TELE|nr:zinc finger protein RFP-like [Sphaeramia orbicularis]XP_030018392.1 zinc finger protein RFP-like [Sphaeramia orbicularis]
MAAAGPLKSDQFLCSICLDVFTDPVTTSCGHNFCNSCITEHWDNNVVYYCPMCKMVFHTRPELHINTFISEMVSQFRHEAQHEPNIYSSDQQAAKPGEVPCDICTETKLKALKSCLVCLTSYCQTHLEPHLTLSGLKRHQLIPPVENLEDRMCRKHDKPLELFCKTDHTCICLLCPVLDHKNHDFVPLKEEYEEQETKLKKTQAEIHQMIQERQLKIQEIQHSVDLGKKAADRQTAEGVEVFTALMESVQRSLDQLKEEIQQKQRTTEKQAEDFIKELEQEISKLKKRSTEVEQLSGSEDHLHFVQRFTSINTAPPMKTWKKVSVRPPSYEEIVVRAVSQLENKVREDKTKLLKVKLKTVQQYEVDVTLDPDTAYPKLILSDDGKQVHHVNQKRSIPDNLERFSKNPCVLGKQSFSTGRLYFEVQVKEKSKWTIGVVKESINRKVYTASSPQNGYWTIWLRNGNEYRALDNPPVLLSLESIPQKVGVFVDYEEGLVSFYDVDSSALIYSFTGCCFNEKLLPFFSPCNRSGGNSAPLIITPVLPDTEE